MRVVSSFVLLGTIALVTGCGGAGNVPVSGLVLLDGKPITVTKEKTASVGFHPDKSKGNNATSIAVGQVNESGQYTLTYDGKAGAPAGWYKVTVNYSQPSNPKDPYSVPVKLVHQKYFTPEFTDLSVEVKPAAPSGHYDLKVSR